MKNSEYTPPYTLSNKIVNLVYQISEVLTKISASKNTGFNDKLEKENRIKTIQAQNSELLLEQIDDIIKRKNVNLDTQKIKEIKNAYNAFEALYGKNEKSNDDLVDIHKILMEDSLEDAGTLRATSKGSFSGGGLGRMAPPAGMIPKLLKDLFKWLDAADDVHPLIKSCVFHFEFEYIEPFSDGNGRVGRMWQTLILYKWKPIFAILPIESIVKDKKEKYIEILGECDRSADSQKLIEFSLGTIYEALEEFAKIPLAEEEAMESDFEKILEYCQEPRTRDEIQRFAGAKNREQLRKEILKPLVDKGLLKLTMPDKPRSPKQRYYSE